MKIDWDFAEDQDCQAGNSLSVMTEILRKDYGKTFSLRGKYTQYLREACDGIAKPRSEGRKAGERASEFRWHQHKQHTLI
eukprot:scaffold252735_cov19-Prasinocladus_malaysianus.AAC.1